MMRNQLMMMAAMSLGLLFCKAQIQTISFEPAEGYSVGNLSGQQGWSVWGGIPASNGQVMNSNATAGINSFNMTSTGVVRHLCGIEKNISTLATAQDIDISFDYKFSALNFSDYEIAIYNSSSISDYTAAFRIDHLTGNLRYRDATAFVSGPNLLPNQFYNLKIRILKTTNTLSYYLDGNLLYTGPLGTFKNSVMLDFIFDDFGSGFIVDNIKIENSPNLSTQEIDKPIDLSIFPNPAEDFITIKSDDKIQSVVLYDFSGRKLSQISNDNKSNNLQMNIADLPKGVYIVNVKTERSTISKKVIKK